MRRRTAESASGGGGATDLGVVFAAGGVGSILAAAVMAQTGLPRRHMLVLYLTWAASTVAVAGFGIASELWHAMAVSFVCGACGTAG